MMEIAGTLKTAAAVVVSIGTIGGGAFVLDSRHAPLEQVVRLESSARVNAIQNWIRAAREEGVSEYICDSIRAELIALCTEQANHYLCSPKAYAETLSRAGCR